MPNEKELVQEAELNIDKAFSDNKLKHIGYEQAVWTLLSAIEDRYFFRINNGSTDEQLNIFADNYINFINHPLRICYREASRENRKIKKVLFNEHYKLAMDWINISGSYRDFCSIFPLWYRNKIDISIIGDELVTTNWRKLDLRYEAYNRVFEKEDKEKRIAPDSKKILDLIQPHVSTTENSFNINFNPELVSKLKLEFEPCVTPSYKLPEDWEFSSFTLGNFKSVFITIQSMLYAWLLVRTICAQNGMPGLGYSSSIWLPQKEELKNRLVLYTGLESEIVSSVLEMLALGKSGVRNPDIALQPLVDLENNNYALSPFIWLNVNAERNICALINQIEIEKLIYSKLTQEKEILLRSEIKKFLEPMGYEIKHGSVGSTDVDVAIIDRKNRVCLCLELKWFIGPAEIREIHERSQELIKGIKQAKIINTMFQDGDSHLISNLLQIDKEYHFLAVVGSENWIGHFDIQDENIPIIKVWHLLENIKQRDSLLEILSWLKERNYLPNEGNEYSVQAKELSCGKWRATWYGIDTILSS